MHIKIRGLFLLSVFLIPSVWFGMMPVRTSAQTVADSIQRILDSSELRQYRQSRLSVRIKTKTQRTIEITGNRYYDVFGQQITQRTVQKSGETYKSWIPYRGFQRISEPKFFKIAGYERQAQKARAFHTSHGERFGLLGQFGLSFVASGGILQIIASRSGGSGIDPVAGGFVALGGLMALIDLVTSGEDSYVSGPPMWAPASQVHGIAAEYNRQLLKSLRDAN